MKILYVGSGLSALQVKRGGYDGHITVALNNAWRAFEKAPCDYWIHPNDFPVENYPPAGRFREEIPHRVYNAVIQRSAAAIGIKGVEGFALECFIGYTSFFQGLYWIMANFRPQQIGLLGFDHDYNGAKVKKWEADAKPTIQNSFNGQQETTVQAWAEKYFAGYDTDAFYGHGTPDPLRFGTQYIEKKMQIAQQTADRLGIRLVNYSYRPSPFAVFSREPQ
ncbi:hypothetical protein [Siccibacter colletis]|uniref:hypothetical protein n=1 Tax=Siccibacter colletis TaxID=1505757 RepID=UPI003CF86DCA